MSRLWQLDALRASAIIAVLLYHFLALDQSGPASPTARRLVSGLWAGVDLFFVISGFLITGILARCENHPKRYRLFYARRTLRIFPLYFFWLLVVFGGNWIAPRPTIDALEPIATFFVTYTYNIWVAVHGSWPVSDRLNHLWSLGIEEQFYLLWPWIFFLLPRRCFLVATLGAIAASQLAKAALFFSSVPWWVPYNFPFTRMDALLVGAVAAHLWRYHRDARWLAPGARAVTLVGAAGLLVLGWAQGHLFLTEASIAFGTSALAWMFGGLTLTVLTSSALREEPRRLGPPIRFIATLSYGMYMCHWIIRCALIDYGLMPSGFGLLARFCLLSALTIAVSWVVYRVVELPFLNMKRFFRYG